MWRKPSALSPLLSPSCSPSYSMPSLTFRSVHSQFPSTVLTTTTNLTTSFHLHHFLHSPTFLHCYLIPSLPSLCCLRAFSSSLLPQLSSYLISAFFSTSSPPTHLSCLLSSIALCHRCHPSSPSAAIVVKLDQVGPEDNRVG